MATNRIRYTQETVNFARLTACIIGPCTKMMRDLLQKHVQPVSLRSLVKIKLNYEQKRQLSLGSIPDYSNFDATFLYSLLRTQGICTPNINPPTNGWGIPPKLALELTTGDDLERIRVMKNELCSHIKKPELTQPEFNSKISVIKDIAGRFDIMFATNGDFVTEIDDMLKEPLEREAGESYIEQIRDLIGQDQETKDKIEELAGIIQDIDVRYCKSLKDMDVRLSKALKDMVFRQSKALGAIGIQLSKPKTPKDKAKRDELIAISKGKIERDLGKIDIVKISAYDIIIAKLLKDGFAVVTGIPGDGKTTLANYVIHDIIKDKIQGISGKQPLIITKLSQWQEVVRQSENLIIFIDDMFGISNEMTLKEWKEIMDNVEDVCSDKNDPRRNFLIVALRRDALKSCPLAIKNHMLFQSLCNLKDDKNFSKEEKINFLKKCYEQTPFTSEESDKIVERTKYLGFPQCCYLFIRDKNLQKRGAEFFYQPFVFLKMQLQNLWDCEETKFIALAFVMLNGGRVHKEDFLTSDNNDKIKNVCRKENQTNILRRCLDAARSLEGTYLSNCADVFTFTHDSIYHAVAMVLWEDSCKGVIQHCSVDFLSNVIHPKMSQHIQTDSFIISDYYIPDLTNRIVNEISFTKPQTNKFIANLKIWEDAEICKKVNEEIIQQSERVNLNNEDEDANSLMHYAVGARNIPFVEYLFTHSPSQQQCYKAFNLACEEGDLEIFDICTRHMHNARVTLESLFLAVKGGNGEIYKQLMKTADENFDFYSKCRSDKSEETVTILQEICLHGKLDLLKLSIQDITIENFMSIAVEQKLLQYAARGGSVNMLEYMIQRGVDVYQKDPETGATVLHSTSLYGNLGSVKYLSQISGLLKITDKHKRTPLHYVGEVSGSVDMAVYLINEGLDVYTEDDTGCTAFHLACMRGNLNLVKFLHERDSKLIRMSDEDNATPLHYVAIGTGSVDVAVYLISEGVDIHTKDADGVTAFHWACFKGNLNLVKFLHERDSMLIKMSDNDKVTPTPLHYVAFGTESVDVADYLINKGVDTDAKYTDGVTAFHLACWKENLNLVEYLHERNSMLIKMSDNDKATALHYVADGTGSVDVAVYLINEGVDIHTKNTDGGTAFHWACRKENLNLVKFLHERDCMLIKMSDNDKDTSLHYVAFGTGSVDVADYLINEGANVNTKGTDGSTAFHLACSKGHLNLVKLLHERDSTLIQLSNKYNRTPLHHIATGTGSVDVAVYLIKEGIDIHAEDTDGITAIHLACKKGNLNLLKFLHERGSKLVKLSNKYHRTSLHFVAMGTGSVDVAVYLLDKGVDLHIKDTDGGTAFHKACREGNLNLVKFLHGKDSMLIQMSNKDNRTPLHYVAMGTGSIDVAVYLINEGVDVHTEDTDGSTAFHWACKKGNLNLVTFLHDYSILIQMSNNYIKTPLHYVAMGTGSVDVAAYLIEKGVDIHTKDTDGGTAFHWACRKGNLNLVKFLLEKDSMLIQMSNKYNRAPLHHVAMGTGSVDVAAYLIEKGVDIHAEDTDGITAIHLACKKGNLNLLMFLHERGCKLIKLSNKCHRTSLHFVAMGTGSVDVAIYLINEGENVHKKDTYGCTAFHWACKKGNLNLVKFLHERHPRLLKMSDKEKATPLHHVARGTGSVDVADYLINKGVDRNAKDANGCTVFHLACRERHLNLVNFLRESYSMSISM